MQPGCSTFSENGENIASYRGITSFHKSTGRFSAVVSQRLVQLLLNRPPPPGVKFQSWDGRYERLQFRYVQGKSLQVCNCLRPQLKIFPRTGTSPLQIPAKPLPNSMRIFARASPAHHLSPLTYPLSLLAISAPQPAWAKLIGVTDRLSEAPATSHHIRCADSRCLGTYLLAMPYILVRTCLASPLVTDDED